MPNYKRRFTKDEFKKEMFIHLKDMPPGYLKAPKKLEEIAEWKAQHYERALQALDTAMARVKKLADSHPDDAAGKEAENAVREINDAINAYGEASMSGNSQWEPFRDAE